MQTRLILAIAISLFILLTFQQFQAPPPDPALPREERVEAERRAAPAETEPAPRYQPSEEYQTALLADESRNVTVNAADAGLSGLVIVDKDGSRLDLVMSAEPPFPMGMSGFGEWSLSDTAANNLVTARASADGIDAERRFTLGEDGVLRVTNILVNRTADPRTVRLETGWYGGLGTTEELLDDNYKDNKPFAKLNGRVRTTLGPGAYEGSISWVGMLNRYFIAAYLDMDEAFGTVGVREGQSGGFLRGRGDLAYPEIAASGEVRIGAGESYEFTESLYAGLKEYDNLRSLNSDFGNLFAFGFFGFLSKIFLNILIWIYSIVGNYGVAIIFLTLILQVVMFPLNAKSFKSMKAMKEIQPHMTKLRAKYKEDPQRMNQEMMVLYKKYKVNPLGGCLPMLLQLPIFISLFTMLRSTAELRYSSFLWIGDLARADSLFAGIPGLNAVPVIGSGGPLPLLMGGAMFLQQKMMGSAEGPQKTMTYMMPVIFTFMFMNFPAGLVLYWLSNSIFTFITQYSMSKRTG